VPRDINNSCPPPLAKRPADERECERCLLAPLREVVFVEGETQLAVFEDEVLSRVVVPAPRLLHVLGLRMSQAGERDPGRRDHMSGSCFLGCGAWNLAALARLRRRSAAARSGQTGSTSSDRSAPARWGCSNR